MTDGLKDVTLDYVSRAHRRPTTKFVTFFHRAIGTKHAGARTNALEPTRLDRKAKAIIYAQGTLSAARRA